MCVCVCVIIMSNLLFYCRDYIRRLLNIKYFCHLRRCGDARGSIMVNNRPRDMKIFRKMSRYIMQEDLLQPSLTVMESMEISTDLKLGNTIPKDEKLNSVMTAQINYSKIDQLGFYNKHCFVLFSQIEHILQLLRLTKAKHTLMEALSGGEKKRLSIALELVNNPPVLFLDEPTTYVLLSYYTIIIFFFLLKF